MPIPVEPEPAILPVPVPEASTPALKDKRLWVTATTMLAVLLNKKLGLNLGTEELAFIGTMAAGYIFQSQAGAVMKSRAMGQAAADAIKTPSDALSVLGGPAKMLAIALVGALALGLPGLARADDAGVPDGAPVKLRITSGQVQLGPDAVKSVGPGCYLDDEACVASGKEVVDLRTRVKELEGSPASWVASVGLVVLALGAGFAVGWVVKK